MSYAYYDVGDDCAVHVLFYAANVDGVEWTSCFNWNSNVVCC